MSLKSLKLSFLVSKVALLTRPCYVTARTRNEMGEGSSGPQDRWLRKDSVTRLRLGGPEARLHVQPRSGTMLVRCQSTGEAATVLKEHLRGHPPS